MEWKSSPTSLHRRHNAKPTSTSQPPTRLACLLKKGVRATRPHWHQLTLAGAASLAPTKHGIVAKSAKRLRSVARLVLCGRNGFANSRHGMTGDSPSLTSTSAQRGRVAHAPITSLPFWLHHDAYLTLCIEELFGEFRHRSRIDAVEFFGVLRVVIERQLIG